MTDVAGTLDSTPNSTGMPDHIPSASSFREQSPFVLDKDKNDADPMAVREDATSSVHLSADEIPVELLPWEPIWKMHHQPANAKSEKDEHRGEEEHNSKDSRSVMDRNDGDAAEAQEGLGVSQDASQGPRESARSYWRSVLAARRRETKLQRAMARKDTSGQVPRKVLRLPPLPPPLPPCLQCVLGGLCCSLTARPYAKLYINDQVDVHRKLSPAVPSWYDPLTSFARLVKELHAACSTWESFISRLAYESQQLEQRFMKQAIARGATDSPFLPQPPDQCDQCVRSGERGCLQQTANLAVDRVARPDGMPVSEAEMEVAWFASSGPPPLSLLPQHASMILDQVRVGHYGAAMQNVHRYLQKNPRLAYVPLEAVFCRDPQAMTAAQVLAKAKSLFEKMAQLKEKRKEGDTVKGKEEEKDREKTQEDAQEQAVDEADRDLVELTLRPATRVEISRMLPRQSRINVYAERGVATAHQSQTSVDGRVPSPKAAHCEPRPVKMRGPRKALPFWDPSTMMAHEPDERAHVRDIEGIADFGLDLLFGNVEDEDEEEKKEEKEDVPAVSRGIKGALVSFWRALL